MAHIADSFKLGEGMHLSNTQFIDSGEVWKLPRCRPLRLPMLSNIHVWKSLMCQWKITTRFEERRIALNMVDTGLSLGGDNTQIRCEWRWFGRSSAVKRLVTSIICKLICLQRISISLKIRSYSSGQ